MSATASSRFARLALAGDGCAMGANAEAAPSPAEGCSLLDPFVESMRAPWDRPRRCALYRLEGEFRRAILKLEERETPNGRPKTASRRRASHAETREVRWAAAAPTRLTSAPSCTLIT